MPCSNPFVIGGITFYLKILLYTLTMKLLSNGILRLMSIQSMLGGLSILVSIRLCLNISLVLRKRSLMPVIVDLMSTLFSMTVFYFEVCNYAFPRLHSETF